MFFLIWVYKTFIISCRQWFRCEE